MNHRDTCGKTLPSEAEMHLRAGVMISRDDGQTWQDGGDTDATHDKVSGGAVHGSVEPAIVELSEGTAYMLMRTGSSHLYQARSSDEPKTWTGIGPSPLLGGRQPEDDVFDPDGAAVGPQSDGAFAKAGARLFGRGRPVIRLGPLHHVSSIDIRGDRFP